MTRTGILIGAFAAATFASAAEAARCPSGQIWRVSKKVCMSKDAAIKAGIYKGGKSAGKPRKALPTRIVTRGATPGTPAARVHAPVVPAAVKPAIKPVPENAVTPPERPVAAVRPEPAPALTPRPETSPIPMRLVKPVIVDTKAILRSPSFVKPVPAPLAQEPKQESLKKAQPLQRQQVEASGEKAQMNALKNKLEQHIERNRGKLTNRALPGD